MSKTEKGSNCHLDALLCCDLLLPPALTPLEDVIVDDLVVANADVDGVENL